MNPQNKSPHTATTSSAQVNPTPEQISELARTLWVEEGKPEGRDLQHWLEAERQLRAGGAGARLSSRREPSGERTSSTLSKRDVESDKRVDGLSAPNRDPRTPKGERL